MTKRILLYSLLTWTLLSMPLSAGQASKWTPPVGQIDNRPSDEIAWDQLQLQMSATKEPGEGTTSPQPNFKFLADLANGYQTKYPNSVKGVQAKALELQNLLNCSLAGDTFRADRAAALLADLRSEKKLDIEQRCQLVRLSYIASGAIGSSADAERAARNLIYEFPNQRAGYEWLLQLAKNSSAEKLASIAAELVQSAPTADIQQAAKLMLDRAALVGKTLGPIADTALGDKNAISSIKNKAVVIFVWASWSPGQLLVAKALDKQLPANVALVGVNIDEDVAAAKGVAAGAGLPGTQIYDPRGQLGPLVESLKLGLDLPIYVANAKGEIREVAAEKGDTLSKVTAALR